MGTPGAIATDRSIGRGIAFMFASIVAFALASSFAKSAFDTYSVIEIGFFRSAFAILPALALMPHRGGIALFRTAHPASHLYRAGIGIVSSLLYYVSLQALPLADATALSFAAPLFLTALSVPMLGEKVGIYRWSAVLIGFVGVLIITRPGSDVFNLGTLAGLGSSATWAFAMVSVRKLSKHEHPITITLYYAVIGTALTGLLLPFGWTTPDLKGLVLLASIGLAGGVGQYLVTEAFRHAPAAVAAPLNYVSIVILSVVGFVVWHEVPTPSLLLGSLIVITSGLFIVYREVRRKGPLVQNAVLNPGQD